MMYDIVVIGGGPAGMTAALYGARAGKQVLLLEGEMLGGQILQSEKIENYPALPDADGYTFASNLQQQIRALGVTIESVRAEQITAENDGFRIHGGQKRYEGRTVILATGQKHRHLGVPGEEAFLGRGISFCATCDGMFYRGKTVAVVGGGNTAVQDALVLASLCKQVYLIHRRNELRAERALVVRMQAKENITFLGETVVEEILGEGRVTALRIKHLSSGEAQDLPVNGVFEAVGYLPQNEAFSELVPVDGAGYLLADESGATAVPGIFAAGDGRQKSVRQLTTAVSDGTVAALSAVAYLDAKIDIR